MLMGAKVVSLALFELQSIVGGTTGNHTLSSMGVIQLGKCDKLNMFKAKEHFFPP
jgi:hypothetical protein